MVALVPPLRAEDRADHGRDDEHARDTRDQFQKMVRIIDIRKREKRAPRSAGRPLRRERDDRVAHAGEERRLVLVGAARCSFAPKCTLQISGTGQIAPFGMIRCRFSR